MANQIYWYILIAGLFLMLGIGIYAILMDETSDRDEE
jgi:hypothetical protein